MSDEANLDNLSDDELLQMAGQYGIKTSAPAKPKYDPLEAMSDDELISVAQGYGIKVTPKQPKPIQGPPLPPPGSPGQPLQGSAQFFDFLKPVGDAFNTAGAGLGKMATQFMDNENKAIAQQKEADFNAAVYDTQFTGQDVRPGRNLFGQRLFPESQPANSKDIRNAGLMSGLLSALDAGENLSQVVNPLRWLQKPSDFQGAFEEQPSVSKTKQRYPEAFQSAEGVGEMSAPMPGGIGARAEAALAKKVAKETAKEIAKRIGTNVVKDAGVGAAMGGTFENSRQMKQGEFDPGKLLESLAGGAVAGAGMGTVIHGGLEAGGQATKAVRGAWNKRVRKAITATPAQAAQNLTSTAGARDAALARLMKDAGDNEAFQALKDFDGVESAKQVQAEAAQHAPVAHTPAPAAPTPAPANPWRQSIDSIRNATPENIDEAMANAAALKRKTLKGSAKEYRKEKQAELDAAYEEYKRGQVRASLAQQAAAPPPDWGKPIMNARRGDEAPRVEPVVPSRPTPAPEPAPAPEPSPIMNDERSRYPKAFEPLATEKVKGEKTAHTEWDDDAQDYVERKGSKAQTYQDEVMPQHLPNSRLQAEIEFSEREAKRTTNSPSLRTMHKEIVEQLVQEKTRRAERQAKGFPEDHAPEPAAEQPAAPEQPPTEPLKAFAEMSDEELNHALASDTEGVHTDAIMAEMDRRAEAPPEEPKTKPIEPPTEEAPQGQFRYRTPEHLGHEQAVGERNYPSSAIGTSKTLAHLKPLTATISTGETVDVAEASRRLLQAKTDAKYLEDVTEKYGQELLKHFAPNDEALTGKTADGKKVVIRRTTEKTEKQLPGDKRSELEKFRHDNADLEKERLLSKHTETLTSEYTDKHLQDLQPPATTDVNSPEAIQAFTQLNQLKRKALDADNAYKALSKDTRDLFEQAELAHRKQNNNEHLRLEATADLKHVDLATGEFTEPKKQLTGIIHHKNESKSYDLKDNAKQAYESLKKYLVDTFAKEKTKIKVSAVAGGGLLSALSGSEAHAADGVAKLATHAPDIWANMGDAAPYAAAAVALIKGAPAVAKKILNSDSQIANYLFKDRIDHIEHLDKVLGTNLAGEIWTDNLGQAYRATFGVTFDSSLQRQEALTLLRHGEVKPAEAMAGKQGTIFETMTPEQRRAAVTYLGVQKNMNKSAQRQMETLESALENNPDLLADKKIEHARDALQQLIDATGAQKRLDGGSRMISEYLSRFMDYNFFWNLEHHGTNLTDSWIGGGSRVGPMNILNAHVLLDPVAGDKELKQLFKSSNLLGSATADRNELKASAILDPTHEFEDLPSDRVNADRVALGSFLQFHGLNKELVKQKTGITNNVEFVKKMLTDPNFDPDLAGAAWGHMAERTSRTLGIDPLKVNGVMLPMAEKSPALGVFLKQPSRMARLMMHNLAEGNWSGTMTAAGAMAFFGGQAAIPAEARWTWSKVDPAGFYAAAKFLNDVSLGGRLGTQLGPKLTWGFLWPVMGAGVPVLDDFKDVAGVNEGFPIAMKALANMAEGKNNDQKTIEQLQKWSANGLALYGSLAQPRILKMVPTRDIVKGIRASKAITKGSIPYYPEDEGAHTMRPLGSVSVKKEGLTESEIYGDQFIPGKPSYLHDRVMAAKEKENRKGYDETMATVARGAKALNPAAGDFISQFAAKQKARPLAYDKVPPMNALTKKKRSIWESLTGHVSNTGK